MFNVHQVKKEWHKICVLEKNTDMGNSVYVCDMERTICDIVRDRKRQDLEIFSKAWKFYLKNSSRDVWKLRDYANIFGISERIESILDVLAYEV